MFIYAIELIVCSDAPLIYQTNSESTRTQKNIVLNVYLYISRSVGHNQNARSLYMVSLAFHISLRIYFGWIVCVCEVIFLNTVQNKKGK